MEIVPTERDQARFWSKAALPNEQGCMLWTASQLPSGYGRFGLTGRVEYAHRVSFVIANGPIPAGLQVDHLCRVRHCVAPLHLEAVTLAENVRRGNSGLFNARKTYCLNGHEFTETNTYAPAAGGRHCRACMRSRDALRRARRLEDQ